MFTTNLSIKSWAEDDRPREKMLLKGRSALSNAELIAILLGSGTRTKTAVDLAQEILTDVNYNLYELGKLNCDELKRYNGIGDAKAITLMAALELGRRRKEEGKKEPVYISRASQAYELVKHHFMDLDHEQFRIIGMTRSNKVIGNDLISQGGRTGTIADGKIIFKRLLDMKAAACILLHNHPSGVLKPSDADIKLTKNLKKFSELIELPILDHLIVTDNGYFSFLEEGLL